MDYIDILILIMRSIIFVYLINYCLDQVKMLESKKLILCIVLFSVISYITPIIVKDIPIIIFFVHILSAIIVYLLFNKKIFNALTVFSIIYLIGGIWVFVSGNLLYGIIQLTFSANYIKFSACIFIKISQLILFSLIYIFKPKIKEIYRSLSYDNNSVSYTIIISFLPDFLISLFLTSYDASNSVISNLVVIVLLMLLGFNMLLLSKIVKRANDIYKLNKNLAINNNELKNIKNEYGLQINCIYELCVMEKYDDAASVLKSIISPDGKDITDKGVNNNSLLSLATKHAACDYIDVIVEGNVNFKFITISEIELYRIILNIVNNAIRAIKDKGTITAKAYETLDNIVVTIENDGDKIPEEIIDKIFDSGFTTKNNYDESHGYGLCIAKEIIENNSGKILVESNEATTKFTIILPKKRIEMADDL